MYRKIVAIPADNNELSFINHPHTAFGFRQYIGNKDLVEVFIIFFPMVIRMAGFYNYCSGGNYFRYRWFSKHYVDYLNVYLLKQGLKCLKLG